MKKLPKYKTQDNAWMFPITFEANSGISMTIQNDTYSLREIVEKFTREYPVHLQRTGYYDQDFENENFDDVDITRTPDFDLTDAIELKQQIREKEQKMSSFKKNKNAEKNEVIQDKQVEQKEAKPSDV